ncbi:integrator complex subunit 14 isoform X2 [Nilaparvata lugens]|nr:integrator complex subunit 14 isoform X2 [Nilaparvata lugens]
MPTIVAVDVSLSMAQPVALESGETFTRLQLAIHGINTLLDYFSLYSKLEFVAVVAFSSACEVISHFTRDFDQLKLKLNRLEECDKQDIEAALQAINTIVLSEWGTATPCQVIVITDGDLTKVSQPSAALPFPFPGKMVAVALTAAGSHTPNLRRLVEASGGPDGCVLMPDSQHLSPACVHSLFHKLAQDNYSSFTGTLKCGHLACKVILSPSPVPYTKTTDFDVETMSLSGVLEVCGFVEVAHVGSPAAVSRHLVLPHPASNPAPHPAPAPSPVKTEAPESDDDNHDDGRTPSFCVLLHGALKVENMAAICQVGSDWYGVLYSWADSKKKSNLMLTLLEPGTDTVPWLGNFKHLGVLSDPENPNPEETFPIRPAEKRSYSQNNCVVWIRQAGLQSDIQKILRHARKLPEKTTHFYKELNRVRRAAIALGFMSLVDGLAAILERECTLLPGTAHPDCALQLTHAAGALRQPYSRDPKYNVMPMRTKYTDAD